MAMMRSLSDTSSSPADDLKATVSKLHEQFQKEWKNYPHIKLLRLFDGGAQLEDAELYQIHDLDHTVRDLVHQFETCQSIETLHTQFETLRESWHKACLTHKITPQFSKAYNFYTQILEAYFIKFFLNKLSLITLPDEKKSASGEGDDYCDIEKILAKYHCHLKEYLEQSFLTKYNECKAPLDDLVHEVEQQIMQVSTALDKHLEKRPPPPNRIKRLIREEFELANDCNQVDQLKLKYNELRQQKIALLADKQNAIQVFFAKEKENQSPRGSFDVGNEFVSLRAELQVIRALITAKKYKYSSMPEQKKAMEIFKSLLGQPRPHPGFELDIDDYQRAYIYYLDTTKWAWNANVRATHALLLMHYKELAILLINQKSAEQYERELEAIRSLESYELGKQAELELLERELKTKIDRHFSEKEINLLRTEIIGRYEAALALSQPDLLIHINEESITERRSLLDQAWESCLSTESDLLLANALLNKMIGERLNHYEAQPKTPDNQNACRLLSGVFKSLTRKFKRYDKRLKPPAEMKMISVVTETMPAALPEEVVAPSETVIESPRLLVQEVLPPFSPSPQPLVMPKQNKISMARLLLVGLVTAVVGTAAAYCFLGPVVTLLAVGVVGFAIGAVGYGLYRCSQRPAMIPDRLRHISLLAEQDLTQISRATTSRLVTRFGAQNRTVPRVEALSVSPKIKPLWKSPLELADLSRPVAVVSPSTYTHQ